MYRLVLLLLTLALGSQQTHGKEKWFIANAGNLEIFSNTYENRTKTLASELLQIQQTLANIFPSISKDNHRKIRIFILKNADTLSQFAPLYNGKAKRNMAGWFTYDLEGPLLVIKASSDVNETRETLYHEFIHFITSSPTTNIPLWLNEGIAEVFSSIEIGAKKTTIGKAIQSNANFLKYYDLMELEKLFQVGYDSSEYNQADEHRGIFYAQSWAIVHYFLFGEQNLPPDAFAKLAKLATSTPSFSENEFVEAIGLNYKEMKAELDSYVLGGNYYYNVLETSPALTTDWNIRKASEAEATLIQGILLLSSRGPDSAQDLLMKAANSLSNTPMLPQYIGYFYYKKELWQLAVENLEKAIALGAETPSIYLLLASAKMQLIGPSTNINKADTKELLRLLYKSKALGDFSATLYINISKVWASTAVPLKDAYIEPIKEGVQVYPSDSTLTANLAICYYKMGKREESLKILDNYLSNPINKGKRTQPLLELRKIVTNG